MVIKVSLENYQLSDNSKSYIKKKIDKLARLLVNMAPDLPVLRLTLRDYPAKNYFDGSITLTLPKAVLNAHSRGLSLTHTVKLGFEKIFREVKKYKGKHFVGDREYPKHNISIRYG